ncbi:uncharacterized protein LOC114433006 isoform X2 [Parambassis ranga]|uniref:Uncharacterized protein LOC114433006 isoform X2 n=1 Tax=Parambassis ranga TaxID=210632 RepID=A0A6P7HTR1_9TELE|nr:uncharacterized protein LOC114433006 isoform X2 [Parambassis ranga]
MAASELLPVRDLHKQNGYPCYSFGYKDKGEKKQRYCEKRRRVEMDDTEEGSQLMDVGVRTDSMRLRLDSPRSRNTGGLFMMSGC